MKILSVTVKTCFQCPHFRRYGSRAVPGCSHGAFRDHAFGAKELPNTNVRDEYNGSLVAEPSGEIPTWCPLPNRTNI